MVMLSACGGAATSAPGTGPASSPSAAPASFVQVTAEPTEAADTEQPADTPDPDTAYQQLLAAIPPEIAAICTQFHYTQSVPAEPGEIAEADCDFPSGSTSADYVTYKLFIDPGSMDDWYDLQKKGITKGGGKVSGPGCGKGPGESQLDTGRKLCYVFITDDANVMWTNETLFVWASALRDDGNWAKLDAFWSTAGPVTP